MEIKTFARRTWLLVLPYVLYSIVCGIIDPYDYFTFFSPISKEIKQETSYRLNYAIWKTTRFRQDPCPNILLGDSRMNRLSTNYIQEMTGKKYFSFAYGGGTLSEITSTFWYASKYTHLENVYIGMNFNLYNGYDLRDRVPGAASIQRNPLLYFSNLDVLESVLKIVCVTCFGDNVELEKPPMSREAFWQYQLNVSARSYYRNYKYPKNYYAELLRIKEYCWENSVNLVFIIFPTHVDLQRRVHDFMLAQEYTRFKRDLASIAKTYDFDYDNEVTREKSNFTDPFHFTEAVGLEIIQQVWGTSKGVGTVAVGFEPHRCDGHRERDAPI